MKIGGMGYAILRVTAEQLRELHTIPKDVVFIKTMDGATSQWASMPDGWYHDEHPFYFRIQHPYLPRAPDRGPLMVVTLRDLIKQMEEVRAMEELKRGEPVPEHLRDSSVWVDDNA